MDGVSQARDGVGGFALGAEIPVCDEFVGVKSGPFLDLGELLAGQAAFVEGAVQ
jgi:hypothetical protein